MKQPRPSLEKYIRLYIHEQEERRRQEQPAPIEEEQRPMTEIERMISDLVSDYHMIINRIEILNRLDRITIFDMELVQFYIDKIKFFINDNLKSQ